MTSAAAIKGAGIFRNSKGFRERVGLGECPS